MKDAALLLVADTVGKLILYPVTSRRTLGW